jgi:hypothetical protein
VQAGASRLYRLDVTRSIARKCAGNELTAGAISPPSAAVQRPMTRAARAKSSTDWGRADGLAPSVHYPTLMLADRITLAHLSVNSTTLPNSALELVKGMPT